MILLESNPLTDNFILPILVIIVVAIGGYFLTKFLIRKKIKIIVNYSNSFWTTYEQHNYLVLNITIINDNEFDLNSLLFSTEPNHNLTDNIWSRPDVSRSGSATVIMGSMKEIQDSLGDQPISVTERNRKTGSLVFESNTQNCSITTLIMSYQDKQIKVKVDFSQINNRNL